MQDRGQEEAGGKVRGQNGDITCQTCVHGCEEDKTMVFFLFIYLFLLLSHRLKNRCKLPQLVFQTKHI